MRNRDNTTIGNFALLAALATALALAGCNTNPLEICTDDCDAMPADAGSDADACVDSGNEVCDGIDNNCNGEIDEGVLEGEGEVCSTNVGECREGVTECIDGAIACGGDGVTPEPEVCDGLDNDCNGVADNGNPGGGVPCSNDIGECRMGVTDCMGGGLVCAGGVEAIGELCDGLDNDCDGNFDENIPPGGSCGTTDVGECSLGTFQCSGGVTQCVGVLNPTTEQCDNLDHDCDGNTLNGFDLNNDPRNCGTCGNVCTAANALAQCDGSGDCEIALCMTDYWDVNGVFTDGCEYNCQFQNSQEGCNQIDDDCDTVVDEDLAPPTDLCESAGECAGTVPTCTTSGFVCNYSSTVQTDANGAIVSETLCDGLDNDCDGNVDESHPAKGGFCGDSQVGECQTTGTLICNAADPGGPTICDDSNPGQMAISELCNNKDDDCDGNVDEGALAGDIQAWVNIGGGLEMFAFEASHPDASNVDFGSSTAYVCSTPNALPWTNITRPQAEAACNSIGARLCTEFEWQRACKGLAPRATPVQQDTSANRLVFIEAEEFTSAIARSGKRWVLDNSPGYSGAGALRASPNTGAVNDSGSTPISSPQLDFQVNFNTTGAHTVWVLGWGGGSGDRTVHVGIDNTLPATSDDMNGFVDGWAWSKSTQSGNATIDVPSTGLHTINVWMRDDGFRIDAILLTTSTSFVPTLSSPNGCDWSYGTSCNTYQANVCNGLDFDGDPATPGNQDRAVPSGSRAACFTDLGAAGQLFDMSGNIKEWTAPRETGINAIRGGSFTTTQDGMQCDFLFTVADDAFFFPNVGFRCCR